MQTVDVVVLGAGAAGLMAAIEAGRRGRCTVVIDHAEKIGKKIRDTELAKVPYMLVIGEKEMNENKVAVRRQGKGDQGTQSVDEFLNGIIDEVKERKGE